MYTSCRWLCGLFLVDKVRVSYGERGAKVSRMESFWVHEKGERLLFFETETREDLEEVMGRQMDYCNSERRYPRLTYHLPWESLPSQDLCP